MKDPYILELLYDLLGSLQPKRQRILNSRVEDQALMLAFDDPEQTVRRHILNKTAREIYELCDGQRTLNEICSVMHQNYKEVPWETIANDLLQTTRILERKGILEF